MLSLQILLETAIVFQLFLTCLYDYKLSVQRRNPKNSIRKSLETTFINVTLNLLQEVNLCVAKLLGRMSIDNVMVVVTEQNSQRKNNSYMCNQIFSLL